MFKGQLRLISTASSFPVLNIVASEFVAYLINSKVIKTQDVDLNDI